MIRRAAALLKTAKRPVILLGGAALRANEQAPLVELAETLGAAVVTTMAGKSVFPEDHPLYVCHIGSKGTPVGLKLTQNADVLLALGTSFADETTCSYKDGAAFSILQSSNVQSFPRQDHTPASVRGFGHRAVWFPWLQPQDGTLRRRPITSIDFSGNCPYN